MGHGDVPALALELDAALASTLSDAQKDVHNVVTDHPAAARDVVVGLNLRLRSSSRVAVEAVAGGGIAFSRFASPSLRVAR